MDSWEQTLWNQCYLMRAWIEILWNKGMELVLLFRNIIYLIPFKFYSAYISMSTNMEQYLTWSSSGQQLGNNCDSLIRDKDHIKLDRKLPKNYSRTGQVIEEIAKQTN